LFVFAIGGVLVSYILVADQFVLPLATFFVIKRSKKFVFLVLVLCVLHMNNVFLVHQNVHYTTDIVPTLLKKFVLLVRYFFAKAVFISGCAMVVEK
jgi:hypothetical protein